MKQKPPKPQKNDPISSERKKKKTIIIIAASVIVSVTIIAAAVILIILLGDDQPGTDVYSESDMQTVIQQEWDNSLGEDAPAFMQTLNECTSFSVDSCTDDGEGHYTAYVTVNGPDINQALKDYQASVTGELSEEEMDNEICRLISEAAYTSSEHTIYIVQATDGNYHVQFPQDFVNAMSGYAFTESFDAMLEEDAFFVE